jgi:predicted phosphodiesterase
LQHARAKHDNGGSSEEVPVTVEHLKDLDELIRARGLEPDEWRVDRVKVNEWTAADGSLAHQLVAYLKPKLTVDMLVPAVDVRPIAAPRKPDPAKPRLIVFVGDEQEPYSDPVLKQLFLRWLAFNKPDEGVHLGDLMDFPTISRHRDNPAYNATPQECVNAGYATLRSYREASVGTAWSYLRGNHDDRLRAEQLARAERIYGLRPADVDDTEFDQALSLRNLLHLDALQVTYVGDDGQYEQSEIEVAPDLVARHGWITGSNSAEKTLRKIGCDVVVGHTHRQRIHWATEVRRGKTLTTQAVESGCMCLVDGGLGYTVNPDWQNGFATAVVWPDGSHQIEHATFIDGSLRWRDQRYSDEGLRLAA